MNEFTSVFVLKEIFGYKDFEKSRWFNVIWKF